MTLHVSSTCAFHQEVKIALHSLWYHHTYRCDDTRGCIIQFWPYIHNILRTSIYLNAGQVPNSAADINQQGPDNLRNHTIRLTTIMYFNQLF